jgi:hypothetical protein
VSALFYQLCPTVILQSITADGPDADEWCRPLDCSRRYGALIDGKPVVVYRVWTALAKCPSAARNTSDAPGYSGAGLRQTPDARNPTSITGRICLLPSLVRKGMSVLTSGCPGDITRQSAPRQSSPARDRPWQRGSPDFEPAHRGIDPGEIRAPAGLRLGVKAFRVAPDTLLERRIDTATRFKHVFSRPMLLGASVPLLLSCVRGGAGRRSGRHPDGQDAAFTTIPCGTAH